MIFLAETILERWRPIPRHVLRLSAYAICHVLRAGVTAKCVSRTLSVMISVAFKSMFRPGREFGIILTLANSDGSHRHGLGNGGGP
jgi:hypothetical protein